MDISAHAVSGVVSLRFRGESGGDSYDYMNDLLVDDVCVVEAPILGCTDPLACNYDPSATIDDASCISAGCADSLANNYDPNAGCDNGTCQYSCTAAPYSENFDSGFILGVHPIWEQVVILAGIIRYINTFNWNRASKRRWSLLQARSCMLRLQTGGPYSLMSEF